MAKKRRDRLPAGIKQLADGRYQIRVTTTDRRTGRRRDVVRTLDHGASLGQAVNARASLQRSLENDSESKHCSVPKVADWAEDWLVMGTWSDRTLVAMAWRIKVMNSVMGALRLDDVRRSDLGALCQHLEAHYAIRTARVCWRTALRCLRDGWDEHQIPEPARRIRPPFRGVTAPVAGRSLGEGGLRAFVASALATKDSDRRCALLLLAWTGARATEVVTLKVENVDLENKVINLDGTKTQAARREIPIVKALETELRQRIGQLGASSPYLLPSWGKSGHRTRVWLWMAVRACGEAAGLGLVTPHDLRRTMVSLLDRAGVDRVVTRSMIGHTDDATTDLYSRPERGQKRAALRLVVGGKCGS